MFLDPFIFLTIFAVATIVTVVSTIAASEVNRDSESYEAMKRREMKEAEWKHEEDMHKLGLEHARNMTILEE